MRPLLSASLLLSLLACKNTAPEPPSAQQAAELARPMHASEGLPPGHPTAMPPGHPTGMPSGHPTGNAPMFAPPSPNDGRPLQWTDPASWRRVPPASQMRRAQYVVPGAAGDGELAVFYFGTGQGGDVESNLSRWYGQLTQPDGRETRAVATRENVTVGPLRVTVTTATGNTTGGGMPGMPAAPARTNQGLLAAIVETPDGPWFFKLTGPAATLAAARPAFDEMVRSMRF